jgi:hypothetical protein
VEIRGENVRCFADFVKTVVEVRFYWNAALAAAFFSLRTTTTTTRTSIGKKSLIGLRQSTGCLACL